jgi:hypothetical protein
VSDKAFQVILDIIEALVATLADKGLIDATDIMYIIRAARSEFGE